VDAYDGTVTLYVVDDQDPIIEAYQDAFPELFTPGDEMSDELRAHLRYPEDLFRIQTGIYGRYHLDDPDDFFNQDDAWRVARDPGTAGADPSTQVTNEAGEATGEERAARIAPYYQLLQLPQGESAAEGEAEGEAAATPAEAAQAEMVMMRPFVPASGDDSTPLMTAFMAARMDPDNYGQLLVYEMSSRDLPPGPGTASSTINADETVSLLKNRLGTGGSEVRMGNLLLVPIDNALLYVQPFYVVADDPTRQLPQLERVIVAFGDDVVIENTLADALTQLFGEEAQTQERPDEAPADPGDIEGDDTEGGTEVVTGTAAEQAAALLDEADTLFAQADEALAEGDFATYGERVEEARAKVDEAIALLQGEEPQEGSDPESTTTTAPP
jgi:uncharacterized membrane protein (UPF0182 family)